MNALAASSLVLAGLITAKVAAASPMRDVARKLACGETAAEVEAGLDALEAAPATPFGVPDESLTGGDDELDSVALDSLLDALALARQRFPELGGRILALLEKWDFCAVTSSGQRWDLAVDGGGKLVRKRPARMSPLLGSGYAAWSLLPRTANGRPRPSDRGEQQAAPAGSAAQVLQCRDGDALQSTPAGSLPMFVPDDDEADPTCQGPPPPPPPEAAAAKGGARGGDANKRGRDGAASANKRAASEPLEPPHEVASPDTREAAAPPPGSFSAQLVISATGNVNLGTGLSLAPLRNTFVRAGLSWRLVTKWDEPPSSADDAEPSWSWGIGYDDWRPGTFSLQLNHWGPLRRFGKVAIEGAVATLGYKIPVPKRWSEYFSLRTDLSSPLTWSPSLGAGIAFKLPRYFFLSLGISQKLLEDLSPTWSYVLGRSRWKAGTLAVVLANYGPNRLNQLNLRGLALTVSWSWSL